MPRRKTDLFAKIEKRVPWWAWPMILFLPGGWMILGYFLMKGRKK